MLRDSVLGSQPIPLPNNSTAISTLVSAVPVFVVSSIIHMVLPWHKSDYPGVPNEDAVMDALRPLAIPKRHHARSATRCLLRHRFSKELADVDHKRLAGFRRMPQHRFRFDSVASTWPHDANRPLAVVHDPVLADARVEIEIALL